MEKDPFTNKDVEILRLERARGDIGTLTRSGIAGLYTSCVANKFYINAINVMNGAEAITSDNSLPRQETFDIKYRLLEEAKLITCTYYQKEIY